MVGFGGSDLGNWFSGGSRKRELKETHASWEQTERLWQNSALSKSTAWDLGMRILRKTLEEASRIPSHSIVHALAETAEELFEAEDIGRLIPDWPLIENDIAVAMHVRKMLMRRRRWAASFDGMFEIVERQVVPAYCRFLDWLPDECFGGDGDNSAHWFEVPLVSLVENPGEAIEALTRIPYEDQARSFDLFQTLRARFGTNYLIASGLSPSTANERDMDRLIGPTRQKNKNGEQLAELYLSGTPLMRLMEVPIPFKVSDEARFEHCHIVGGTGHGKTQLMQRMICSDLLKAQEDGRSVVVIDSQGDLINKLVRLELFSPDAPNSLCDRLVLIDPSDVEFPAALNLFDAHLDRLKEYRPVDQERVLNGVVELYETFFGALLGAELTQKQGVIFRYLARLMLTIPGATIHTLMQLMEDGRPFGQYMVTLDGSARFFFEKEFFHPSFSATKKQILKRLWGVLSTPAFERMFAQRENKLDLFAALNDGKIILVNTAKDLLKDDGSQLFGRFFIAMLSQAALERSTVPERLRTPTFVYVDEAQEYFGDTIETILNQARKYKVGITLAHQTLDQLSPRLRAVFLSNTSLKCVGGVSARDAHALAAELHTTSDFIEGMRRRGDRTEFAVWLKQRTATALRLSVPLGYLERQPALTEEDYDVVLDLNRERYCGTLADVLRMESAAPVEEAERFREPRRERSLQTEAWPSFEEGRETVVPGTHEPQVPDLPIAQPVMSSLRAPVGARELGKGGPKHRYLQTLVKELAEQQGFRATIEAPLRSGVGQVDVLLERDGAAVAVEISITTPVEQERENVRKCLTAGYARVALVLAKSSVTQGRYRSTIMEGLASADRERVTFLSPEDVPDFVASLAPVPVTSESLIKGYKVRVSRTQVSPEEARSRREMLAKVVARSLS